MTTKEITALWQASGATEKDIIEPMASADTIQDAEDFVLAYPRDRYGFAISATIRGSVDNLRAAAAAAGYQYEARDNDIPWWRKDGFRATLTRTPNTAVGRFSICRDDERVAIVEDVPESMRSYD